MFSLQPGHGHTISKDLKTPEDLMMIVNGL